jgi:hypothetical protein
MPVLTNLTMREPNITPSDMKTLSMSNSSQEMVFRATFWIEGVLTPLVSIGGLAVKLNLISSVVSTDRIRYNGLMLNILFLIISWLPNIGSSKLTTNRQKATDAEGSLLKSM